MNTLANSKYPSLDTMTRNIIARFVKIFSLSAITREIFLTRQNICANVSAMNHAISEDDFWKEVRRALDEIGYDGYLTTELRGGDEAYLTDLAGRIDKFFAM